MDPFGMGSSFGFGGTGGFMSSDNFRKRSSNTAYGGGGTNSPFFTNYSQELAMVGNKKKAAGGVNKFDVSECIVPCTISMIENAILCKKNGEENHNENLVLHGKPVGAVVLRGWIKEVETLASRIKFKLCDGTGVVEVHYNISIGDNESNNNNEDEEIEQEEKTEKKIKNKNWRFKKLECIKKGHLICVVGTVVIMKNENKNEEDVKDSTNSCVCTIEACHFRPINDYNEYAYYSDIEIVFAATQMREVERGNDEESFSCLTTTDEEGIKSRVEQDVKEEEERYEDVHMKDDGKEITDDVSELPESLSHITNPLQIKIIETILRQPENKAGRISTSDIIKLIQKRYSNYSCDSIRNEIDTLLEEGDIIYTHGDFVDVI